MIRAWWCLLVALWLLFAAHSVQAEICPSVVISTRAHTTRKYAIIQMRVSLPKGSPYVNNAAIKVSLPQGISPVVSTRISSSQKGGFRTISSSANGLNVYFTGLRFRKSIKLVVKVGRRLVMAGRRAAFQRRPDGLHTSQAKLSGCTLPSNLTFSTRFYQQDAHGDVVCSVSRTLNVRMQCGSFVA